MEQYIEFGTSISANWNVHKKVQTGNYTVIKEYSGGLKKCGKHSDYRGKKKNQDSAHLMETTCVAF